MKLHVDWTRPISLKYSRTADSFAVALERVPKKAGVYIFGRKYGTNSRRCTWGEQTGYAGASRGNSTIFD